MARAGPRGNLDYFSVYSQPRKQLASNGGEFSGLSLYDFNAGFPSDQNVSSPASPSYPLLTNAYQLPSGHDWLSWDKQTSISPGIDLFSTADPFGNALARHLDTITSVNPLEAAHHMAGYHGQPGVLGGAAARQLFDESMPAPPPAQRCATESSSMYEAPSPGATTATSVDMGLPSRKRKSTSASVGLSSSSSRSSVSPDPGSSSSSSRGRQPHRNPQQQQQQQRHYARQHQQPQRRRSPSGAAVGNPPKKTAHNMIEKRYRTNLNDKIAALRDSVPSLRVMVQRLEQQQQQGSDDGDEEDGEGDPASPTTTTATATATKKKKDEEMDMAGLTPAHKLNKATILSKATEYITHLELRNHTLAKENASLRSRVEGIEMLTKKGDKEMDEDAPDW